MHIQDEMRGDADEGAKQCAIGDADRAYVARKIDAAHDVDDGFGDGTANRDSLAISGNKHRSVWRAQRADYVGQHQDAQISDALEGVVRTDPYTQYPITADEERQSAEQ
jgi:hypothetical protein